jgi:hypothetical protein
MRTELPGSRAFLTFLAYALERGKVAHLEENVAGVNIELLDKEFDALERGRTDGLTT